MKYSEYPIAVIDEQEDQLNDLKKAFERAGRRCFTIQYNVDYTEEPYSGIELLFLDMNLNPGAGQSDKAIFGIVEDAIKSYISSDNGPYVLVFWTTLPELVDGFKEYVSRDKESQLYKQRPFFVDTLPKDKFVVQPQETLESILSQPIVKLVFSLHTSLQEASNKAFKELISCVPLTNLWGDNDEYLRALKRVFTKIAITSVGKQNAFSIPDKAIYEVVGKEVLYHLVKNSSNEWKVFLGINEDVAEEVKNLVYQEWQYKLNTVFHVDAQALDSIDRGAVLTGKKYIFDCLLGRDMSDWYKEEFEISKTEDDDYNIIPVAVEISPSCDYAQGNNRLYKYVLGVCRISKQHPSANLENDGKAPFKKWTRHKNLPSFYMNGLYYKIALSFNYVVGLKLSTIRKLNHLFTLRDEIVTLISNSVADYCSRIGIIDINEK